MEEGLAMGNLVHGEITQEVLGAAFDVHGALGPGFIESIYEAAMERELLLRGLTVGRQVNVPIFYKGVAVATHRLDLLVEGKVVVELKAVDDLADIHTAVAMSYLKASNLRVAMVINFSKPSLQYKRVVR